MASLTLYEFKINNGVNTNIVFDNKPHVCNKPWDFYVAFEDMLYDENIEVVLIGCYKDSRKAIWSNIGSIDLPDTIKQKIDGHLEFMGIQGVNYEAFNYPNKNTGFFLSKNSKDIPQYNELARYFKNELKIKNDDSYSCIYDNGFYRKLSKTELSHLVDNYTMDKASSAQHEAFKKKIVSKCFFPKENFNHPDGFVNLNNGVVNVSTRELQKHSPVFNFQYKLSHNYEPEARAPEFEKFLHFIFNGNMDLIYLLGEIMGYTIIGGDPKAHKCFIFYGDGRNGKSTLLDIIKELLGKHSVSSVSMQRITEPFSVVQMDGKLANIVEESPGLIDSTAFKAIVGGAEVSAAKKHMDEFSLKIKARLFFACNDLPHFKDSSKGLKDRLVIIPFNRYITPQERDPDIKDKLFKEMPGILNFALKGYERFVEQGKKFTQAKNVDESIKEYMSETDSVVSWAEESLTFTENITHRVEMRDLFTSYKDYCKENNFSACNNKTFGKRLKRHLANIIPSNFNVDDIMCRTKSDRYLLCVNLDGKYGINF